MSLKNILDGSIKVSAAVPDPLPVQMLKAQRVSAGGAEINEVHTPKLLADAAEVGTLKVGGSAALSRQYLSDKVTVIYYSVLDPSIGTPVEVKIDRNLFTIAGGVKILSVYGSFDCKAAVSRIEIPVGFICASMLKSFSPTVLDTNNGYVMATAYLTGYNNTMKLTITPDIGKSYTGVTFKVNMFCF